MTTLMNQYLTGGKKLWSQPYHTSTFRLVFEVLLQKKVEQLIDPFQSSPLSLVPKLNKFDVVLMW